MEQSCSHTGYLNIYDDIFSLGPPAKRFSGGDTLRGHHPSCNIIFFGKISIDQHGIYGMVVMRKFTIKIYKFNTVSL